jgi:hypothetical protein
MSTCTRMYISGVPGPTRPDLLRRKGVAGPRRSAAAVAVFAAPAIAGITVD